MIESTMMPRNGLDGSAAGDCMTLGMQSEIAPANGKGREPIWFASYPAGVPATIDADAYPSLPAMLIEACRQHAERPAFECLSARMSYAEWDRDSRDFAAFLVEEANCRPGDRVAIMLPNMLAYPVAFLGALRAGMTAVNVNPLYTPRELQEQLADSGAVVIVIMENFAHKLEEVIAATKIRHVVVARLGDFVPTLKRWAFNFANSYIAHAVPAWHFETFTMLQDACDRPPSERYQDAAVRPGDVALLQYTGGTTGMPKGAMLDAPQSDRQYAAVPGLDRSRRSSRNRARAHAAAALSHLLPDREPVELCASRRLELSHSRSARSAPSHSHHAPRQDHLDVGRQHAVQCAGQHAGIRRIGFWRAARCGRRRRRGAERGGAALARDHRQRIGRGLRPDRSLAGRLHQSVPRARSKAPSACRCRRPKSVSATMPATCSRSGRRAKYGCAARR